MIRSAVAIPKTHALLAARRGRVPRTGIAVEERQIPALGPLGYGLPVAELQGQPHVTRINQVGFAPSIGHENEGIFLADHWKDECALGAERSRRSRAAARVPQLRPRSPDDRKSTRLNS